MARAIGVRQFLEKTFDVYEFDGVWKDSFGFPEKNYRMLIYGKPGNGKTDFAIKLAKYMAQFKRIYYNSFEEGISKSLQDAVKRNKLEEVAGQITFGNRESFQEMMQRLSRRNSAHVVFIDSRDYMNMTHQQYKKLVDTFSRKCFIIICWESAGKPKGEHAKAIEYMADIKVNVRNFKAYPRCRFGGNAPFIIWDKKQKLTLF